MRARTEGVSWRKVDSQIVILDLEDSSYFRTNAVGALLWERLQSECSLADLVGVLVDAYDVDAEVAGRDVTSFLRTVEDKGLLIGSASTPDGSAAPPEGPPPETEGG